MLRSGRDDRRVWLLKTKARESVNESFSESAAVGAFGLTMSPLPPFSASLPPRDLRVALLTVTVRYFYHPDYNSL